eukprot:g2470.t1
MGGAGCGKTEAWKSLARARKLKEPNVHVLCPKAVTSHELFGKIDLESRDWVDGLLPKFLRSLVNIKDEETKWLIVDGDMDAGWAESLNTLMDHNRVLVLQNNERIPLLDHMRVIFEIQDLMHASPSTIGRSGIIYMSMDEGAQWKSILATWVQHLDADQDAKDAMAECVSLYVEPTVEFMKNGQDIVPFSAVGCATTLVAMLTALIGKDMLVGSDVQGVLSNIEKTFNFAMVWAFGGFCGMCRGEDWRKKFSEFWRKCGEFDRVKFPPRDTVFDYWLNPNTNTFAFWTKSPLFYNVQFDSTTTDVSEIVVPTSETCPISFWTQKMILQRRGVLILGGEGVGKSVRIKEAK